MKACKLRRRTLRRCPQYSNDRFTKEELVRAFEGLKARHVRAVAGGDAGEPVTVPLQLPRPRAPSFPP